MHHVLAGDFNAGAFWKLDIVPVFCRFHLSFVGFCKKKTTTNGKEACESKFLITVDGFARFSLATSLQYLPVHSRLFNCDLR